MRNLIFQPLSSLFLLIGLCLSFTTGHAQAPDYTIHQEYTSTRALGMGNAFTAVVDDHSALFYNPAALAFRKDGQVRFFLRAGISDNYMDVMDDIDEANDESDPQKEEKIAAAIEKHYGEHLYSRVPTLGAAWVRPRWGIAFIPADFSTDVTINRQLGPSLGVNAYLDSTLAWGYGRQLKEKWIPKRHKLAMGATLKAIHRAYYSDILSAAQLAVDDEVFKIDRSAEGLTVDMDLGVMWVPYFKPKTFFGKYAKPTFSFVARNIADYGFPVQFEILNDDNPQEPPKLERRFDFGSKFDLPTLWVFSPKLAIDVRDVGHRNWTWMKGFHAGAELYWKMANWWKGHWAIGMNQGYMTAGFGARLAWFQIDVATFGEEVGTTDTPTESRRYILELSIDI